MYVLVCISMHIPIITACFSLHVYLFKSNLNIVSLYVFIFALYYAKRISLLVFLLFVSIDSLL